MPTRGNRFLPLILLVGLLARLAWSLLQPTSLDALKPLPDQLEYLSLARNLLHHHTLVFHDPRFDQDIFAYRTPGYPAFLALCGGSPLAARLAQAVIDTSTALAAYLIATRFLPRRGAVFAAALLAFNPFLIYFSGLLLSETLFIALLAWSVALLVFNTHAERRDATSKSDLPENTAPLQSTPSDPRRSASSRPGALFPFLGTLLLALAAVVRPSGLLLPFLLPAALAYLNPTTVPPYHSRRRWFPAAFGVLMTVALFGLWAARNHSVLGRWVWTTTNEGITQYDGFNPAANGASDQRFVERMPQLREMGEVDRSLYLSALANQYTQDHPERVLTLALAKLGRTFSPIPLSGQFGRPAYRAVAAGYTIPVYLLAFAGLLFPWTSKRTKLLLLLPILYFALVHAFSIGSLRYRMPAEPFFAILASAGLMCLIPSKAHSNR